MNPAWPNGIVDQGRPLAAKVLGRQSSQLHSTEKQMISEQVDAVTTELKRFAEELNLSDIQKEQLRTFLADKHSRLQEFKRQNPNISRPELVQKIASIRGSLREQVVKFLTPQQLVKWDAEVAKGKEFLGQNMST
jgi:hypothetical protein